MEYKKYLVALGLAFASYSAFAECEWSNPGGDKYMLPLSLAVDKLEYIPETARIALKRRLEDPRKHLAADDHILMTSTSVVGSLGSWSISDMNGGNGKVCKGLVTTKTWKPEHTERALVFCEKGWCLAYFSVCRNIALATLVSKKEPDNFLAKAKFNDPIDERLEYYKDFEWKPLKLDVEYIEYKDMTWPTYSYFPVIYSYFPVIYSYFPVATEQLPVVQEQLPVTPIPEPLPVTPIPEPSTLLMLAAGLLLLLLKLKK